MTPRPPTDTELNAMIVARLASIGIDLDQLPPGTQPDPTTGSPGREAALASLRDFVRTTVTPLSGFRFPDAPDGATTGSAVLAQQVAVPQFYPSVSTAWTA